MTRTHFTPFRIVLIFLLTLQALALEALGRGAAAQLDGIYRSFGASYPPFNMFFLHHYKFWWIGFAGCLGLGAFAAWRRRERLLKVATALALIVFLSIAYGAYGGVFRLGTIV